MFGFKKLDEHAELVTRMADTLGVDLAEEAQRGRMRPEQMRNTVLRCVGCLQAGACRDFLAEHMDGADAAPAYCRNKDLLDSLRVG
ncbi:MAG: DUF6455 family protein [Pseudomonadota bacterium]|jgi:hypothetical protein|nr:DUF6455 family protein [Pseudomonadota bacterium]